MGVMLLEFCASTPAPAFYEWRGENSQIDLRGFIQTLGALTFNPDDETFYSHDTDVSGGEAGRLLITAKRGDRIGFEFNGFEIYTATTGTLSALPSTFPVFPERSAALEWNPVQESDRDARLGVDWLNLRLSSERVDLTLGRQPINLATVFYFTPNDFFAPFAPQAFFRIYKAGVDAARAEIRLGRLSQLSVIDVLGYDPDPTTANGWSRDPSLDRSSVLARLSTTLLSFEWGILGGRVYDRSIIGGSFQGELYNWLGVRAEGYYARPSPGGLGAFAKAAIDLEHRFENSLTVRLEPYYNSPGYGYGQNVTTSIQTGPLQSIFGAKAYTALGLGYEFSPLLSAEVLSIANWIDPSYLISVYSVYSLSNDAEFSLGFSLPIGTPPRNGEIKSEFGLLPDSVSAELRFYF